MKKSNKIETHIHKGLHEKVGNGKSIYFYKDKWIFPCPLVDISQPINNLHKKVEDFFLSNKRGIFKL